MKVARDKLKLILLAMSIAAPISSGQVPDGPGRTETEFAAVLDYLSATYPASELPPLNVNSARAIDFESRLSLRRSQAAAIIDYRTKHGRIKSIEELKSIPGADSVKIEAKKDILVF